MNKLFKNREYEHNDRVNTLPFLSYFAPYPIDQDFQFIDKIIDKKKSELYIDLNGKWMFRQYIGYNDVSLENELVDEIEVPCCVQMKGYDYIQYTNWLYPFDFNPPFVPLDNPIFHYRKIININKNDDLFFLNFLGVDSSFYLFINKKYVGYSLISHATSVFDVTNYLLEGKNEIEVIVLKWNASSYLEDQDKFRFSGIFRDVYILRRKKGYIEDFKIEPIKVENSWFVRVRNLSTNPISVNIEKTKVDIPAFSSHDFHIDNPILWEEDNPYLYDVLIFNENEKILQRIGLRTVNIVNKIFYVNDKQIKLRGVNRNEFSPIGGATVTIEETLNDIKLIKSINANAIRTSHYQNIPEFYELCDAYGVYVVAEADLESHGAVGEKYELSKWQDFANNGIYDSAVYDREVSLYERDKNRTSIIIWSLGNESSFGKMFYRGADYIKNHDTRPIHYEGLYNLVDKSDYYTKRVDITSRMYPTLEQIKTEYLQDEKESRPLLICEYTHSMGNSCGDASDYWNLIDDNPSIIGAFVWEWCDHAVLINGKLCYGSDFPMHHNDGNFCVDGLVTPFREFKSNTYEIKAIYEGKRREDYAQKTFNLEEKAANLPLNCIFNEEELTLQVYSETTPLLVEPISVELVRAFIDNEMFTLNSTSKLLNAKRKIVHKDFNKYVISVYDNDTVYLNYEIAYKPYNDGVDVLLSYELLNEIKPTRVGISFALNNIDEVMYEGYGPYESYVDKRVSCKYGLHVHNVVEPTKQYLKPQECGSHFGTSKVWNYYVDIEANKDFSFNVSKYNTQALINAKHNYDLIPTNKSYFYLDLHMDGIGSNSCGPVLDEKYRAKQKDSITFRITFKKRD